MSASKNWFQPLLDSMMDSIDELFCWSYSLFERPYWTRLWVIQELVLASCIEIHCGQLILPWESLAAIVAAKASIIPEMSVSGATRICRQRFTARLLVDPNEAHSISLKSLMETHVEAQCADVRDKVYGLHSLAPDCCRRAVPVDYSCSAYELYGRIVAHEMARHKIRRSKHAESSYRLHKLMVDGSRIQRAPD